MSPAAQLAEHMEPIWWPIDGYAMCCDVCGEIDTRLYVDRDNNIVCARCKGRIEC